MTAIKRYQINLEAIRTDVLVRQAGQLEQIVPVVWQQ